MKMPYKGLSNIQKFFIFLSIIFAVAILDYRSFSNKTMELELYDDLSYRLNTVKISIMKLDYLLNMFVVTGFEKSSVDLIKGETEKLDGNMNDVLGDPKYRALFNKNGLLSQGRDSILNDWQSVKNEILRLHDRLPRDELMLIHNEVDMNTILTVEKSDRLLNSIAETRIGLFADAKSQALKSAVGFILIMLASGFILYRRVLSPVKKATVVAHRFASGDLGARFRDKSRGLVGKLANELNGMLEKISGDLALKEKKNQEIAAESKDKTGHIEAINILLRLEGRSLSRSDVFNAAVKEATGASGAEAAAIYLIEDNKLKLMSSIGFKDNMLKNGASIPLESLKGFEKRESPVFFRNIDEYPDQRYGGLLKDGGFESLLIAPVSYNNEEIGFLYAAGRDKTIIERAAPFLEAVASGVGISAGYINLFYREHDSKKFLERVIRQMPFGVAVFDRTGTCLILNDALKRYLGADPKSTLVGEYRIFEDEVFSSQAIVTSIKKSYEGYSTEFIINYNPLSVKKYNFSGPMRRLKIKSFPLYDQGGEISEIVLLYEELLELVKLSSKPVETLR